MTTTALLRRLRDLGDRGIPACLVTVVRVQGSTPRGVGARMIVCGSGQTYGTIGGGCAERQVRSAALRALLASEGPGLLELDLTGDLGLSDVDVCGGRMWVFLDPQMEAGSERA